MGYNIKNYTEQGGDKTVIGGELSIIEGGKVTFEGKEFSPDKLPKQIAFQTDSVASNTAGLVADFNRLLDKLKASGIMNTEAPVITITIQPEDVNVIEGSISESLSISAEVTPEEDINYQWYSNTTKSNTDGSLIADATSDEFSIPTDLSEGTYYYYCIASSLDAVSVTSEVSTVTVEVPVITITSQPEDLTVTEGSITGSISVQAEVTGNLDLAYQWYSNTTDSNQKGVLIADAITNELSIPTDLTEATYYYYCVVSSNGATSVASETATVTVETAG
jgi:uncharacterized protein YcfL